MHLTTLASGIKLYRFRYLWSETVQVGVMAQDLQKSPLGRDMVTESKDGLQVDAVKAISAALAGNADLHHRVKALEHRRA